MRKGMETQSNGDGEHCSGEHAALERPQTKVQRAIQALEGTKDVYAQELLRLRALNEAIPTKQVFRMMEGSPGCTMELPPCPALLQNLLQEREALSEELRHQKARCEELQRQLEQAHAETLEAQMCLNVLNETVRAALQGEEFLVEQNRHLVSDHHALASKLDEVVLKTHLPAFEIQIKDIEVACNNIKQEEVVLVLCKKACMRGLWVSVELVLFCHAVLWFLLRTLKETYSFAPT